MKHPRRRRLMYLGFQGLRILAQRLPFPAARWCGRTLGSLAYAVLGGYRRVTKTQLHEAFGPALSPPRRNRIARRVFANLGQNAIEWLRLPTLSRGELQQLVVSEGIDHLRQALSKGNGAIVVSAHFGSWELAAPYLVSLGFQAGVLARRLRYPEYESFLIKMRGDKGVPTFVRGAVKDVAKLLRANQILGVVPDQDVDSLEGVFVSFFGRPAYTPVGPAALSLMTGAPILPCFVIREGTRSRLVFEPPLARPQVQDRAQALVRLTQAWSDVVESYVRRYPDHWVWMHRRWKTRPPLAADGPQSAISSQQSAPGVDTSSNGPTVSLHLTGVHRRLLVAGCWLLVAGLAGCAKAGGPSEARQGASVTAATSDAAPVDQMGGHEQWVDGFTLTGYRTDGTKRWELKGRGATLDGDMAVLHHPDGIGYGLSITPGMSQAEGERITYLTASAAQVNQTTRHVRLEHQVTIHTSEGLWLTAPVLHWIPDQERMATDTPVRIETDHMLVRGRGLEGFADMKQAQLLEDVELVLNPTEDEPLSGTRSHVTITCDGPLSFDYERDIATFEQNVHVKDPGGDLYSDKLIAYLEPTTHTIQYAEAIGHVRIQQHQNVAKSERAFYEPGIGKITLTGRPLLTLYPSEESSGAPRSVPIAVSSHPSQ